MLPHPPRPSHSVAQDDKLPHRLLSATSFFISTHSSLLSIISSLFFPSVTVSMLHQGVCFISLWLRQNELKSQFVIFLMICSLLCLYISYFFPVSQTLTWQVALAFSLHTDNTENVCYLYYIYSQGSSSMQSVKLLSKFKTAQSKSSTDAWPRAATYSHTKLTWYGHLKLESPEQCLWWIIQGAYVRHFTVSVSLERQKTIQSHSEFSLWYIISETKQIRLVHCCCVSVCFVGCGVCH